jgi:hypothetical protein
LVRPPDSSTIDDLLSRTYPGSLGVKAIPISATYPSGLAPTDSRMDHSALVSRFAMPLRNGRSSAGGLLTDACRQEPSAHAHLASEALERDGEWLARVAPITTRLFPGDEPAEGSRGSTVTVSARPQKAAALV